MPLEVTVDRDHCAKCGSDKIVPWVHVKDRSGKLNADYNLTAEVVERPNALFRICSEDRALGFADTIRNLATLGTDAARFAALRAELPRLLQCPGGAAAEGATGMDPDAGAASATAFAITRSIPVPMV